MEELDPLLQDLYQVLDLIGVLLNGVIGGTIARQRGYDVIGFLFLALFSALGGGMVRDVLIQQGTAAAIAQPAYLSLAFVGALAALLVNFRGRVWEVFKAHGDAAILGVWSATGAMKAMTYDMPLISSVFMGVLTAVGGGMIRDVVIGQVPSVFAGGTLYAVPAVLASASMVGFHACGLVIPGMIVSPLIGFGLAVFAYWKGWVFPITAEWAPVNQGAARMFRIARRAAPLRRRYRLRDRRQRAREAEECEEGEQAG